MLKQIVPTKLCFSCDVCCRFLDKNSSFAPLFLPHEITPKIKRHLGKSCRVKLKPLQNMYICPFFNSKNNRCAIYSKRPFDCQLYPFTIMFDEKYENITLGIDKKCPFAVDPENGPSIRNHFYYLMDFLERREIANLISKNPTFIGNFQNDVAQFSHLDTLTKLIVNNLAKNGFRKISLEDKPVFDRFFRNIEPPDSSQNFVNLFIWKEKNPVWWKDDHIQHRVLPTATHGVNTGLKILIETDAGYIDFNSLKKFPDYIYLRKDIAELKGNRYKHKRASYNYFSKNYKFQCLPYKQNMKDECLKLFLKWASERKRKFSDLYYHKLLEDSFSAHKLAMENYKMLGLEGRVIKIKNKICAYAFGFELRQDMFCILFEVCDLKYKGISEFIFREFSKELAQYKYINTMDDSGLENLRISKLSYHPISLNASVS